MPFPPLNVAFNPLSDVEGASFVARSFVAQPLSHACLDEEAPVRRCPYMTSF